MFDLKKILEERVKTKGIGKQITAAFICESFDKTVLEVLGSKFKGKVRAISFKDGILKIGVTSSVVAQEVQGYWGNFTDEELNIKRLSFEVRTTLE